MFELLLRSGLAADFDAQGEMPIDVVTLEGEHRTRPTWPDFVHRTLPLVVYVDGHGTHGHPEKMAHDHEISARLVAKGFRVRRFMRWQVQEQPHMVVAALRREIAELRGKYSAETDSKT